MMWRKNVKGEQAHNRAFFNYLTAREAAKLRVPMEVFLYVLLDEVTNTVILKSDYIMSSVEPEHRAS
jgi:hypothetical protein